MLSSISSKSGTNHSSHRKENHSLSNSQTGLLLEANQAVEHEPLEMSVLTKEKKEEKESKKLKKKEKAAEKYAELFPENLILLISTHGEICVSEKHPTYSEVFDIPKSIQYVAKLNLAPLGVSAILTAADVRNVRDAWTSHNLSKSLKDDYNYTSLVQIDQMIQQLMKSEEFVDQLNHQENEDVLTHFMQTVQKEVVPFYRQRLIDDYKEDYDYDKAIQTFKKAVNLHYIAVEGSERMPQSKIDKLEKKNIFPHLFPPRANKAMVDKNYETGIASDNRTVDPKNFGIIALNLKQGKKHYNLFPDILASLGKRSRSSYSSLKLKTSEIFDFISKIKKSNGEPAVKRVLIMDLSCSGFQGENPAYERLLTRFTQDFAFGTKKYGKTEKNGKIGKTGKTKKKALHKNLKKHKKTRRKIK